MDRKQIKKLEKELERISGNWNGKDPGAKEELAGYASEAQELLSELVPLLEALELMPRECPECEGEGEIAVYDRVEPGAPLYHADNRPCGRCKGTGEL